MGRPCNPARRRLAIELRLRGLNFADIGRRLGLTRQAVQCCITRAAKRACCRECDAALHPVAMPRDDRVVLCPACAADAPFAEWLKAHRIAAGLHQNELAARAGVDKTRVVDLERGRNRPRPDTAAKLSRALAEAPPQPVREEAARLLSRPSPRGFAALNPALHRAISRKGGKAAHAKGTAHEWTAEEAAVAGRKGGSGPKPSRGRRPSEGLASLA